VSKNILIRNLTDEQNERLLLLQEKFGVKTNTQALLLLLKYCVVLDDELATLMELYQQVAVLGLVITNVLEKVEKNELSDLEKLNYKIEGTIKLSISQFNKFKYLLELPTSRQTTKKMKMIKEMITNQPNRKNDNKLAEPESDNK
jgi:hypothetical protein